MLCFRILIDRYCEKNATSLEKARSQLLHFSINTCSNSSIKVPIECFKLASNHFHEKLRFGPRIRILIVRKTRENSMNTDITPYSNSTFYVSRGSTFPLELSIDRFKLPLGDTIGNSVTLTLVSES